MMLIMHAFDSLQDTWRAVTIDDKIPVDLFGEHDQRRN